MLAGTYLYLVSDKFEGFKVFIEGRIVVLRFRIYTVHIVAGSIAWNHIKGWLLLLFNLRRGQQHIEVEQMLVHFHELFLRPWQLLISLIFILSKTEKLMRLYSLLLHHLAIDWERSDIFKFLSRFAIHCACMSIDSVLRTNLVELL